MKLSTRAAVSGHHQPIREDQTGVIGRPNAKADMGGNQNEKVEICQMGPQVKKLKDTKTRELTLPMKK